MAAPAWFLAAHEMGAKRSHIQDKRIVRVEQGLDGVRDEVTTLAENFGDLQRQFNQFKADRAERDQVDDERRQKLAKQQAPVFRTIQERL
eukprot:12100761-Karenia_brevis.AAC.1